MYITKYVGFHSLKLRDAFSKVIFLFFSLQSNAETEPIQIIQLSGVGEVESSKIPKI